MHHSHFIIVKLKICKQNVQKEAFRTAYKVARIDGKIPTQCNAEQAEITAEQIEAVRTTYKVARQLSTLYCRQIDNK